MTTSWDEPLYVISVAAELAGMHPQTLRQYDRMGLVVPQRQGGRQRRYSRQDVDRLRTNEVPVAAAVYDTDMYVHRDLSLRTAALIGNTRVWHTSDHQHDGLRVSDGEVMSRVLDLL